MINPHSLEELANLVEQDGKKVFLFVLSSGENVGGTIRCYLRSRFPIPDSPLVMWG